MKYKYSVFVSICRLISVLLQLRGLDSRIVVRVLGFNPNVHSLPVGISVQDA